MNPRPSPADTPPSRRFFCRDYPVCLEVAIRNRWSGFTCDHCRDFQPVVMDIEEWEEDSARCAALLLSLDVDISRAQIPHVVDAFLTGDEN